MESTDNVEVISDKEDGDEMASLRLLEKKDNAESIEEVEGSSDLNIVNEDGTADDDTGSCEIVSKHMEETLLDSVAQEGKEIDKQSDSDNQDEEMELRWDDDDLDEEEVKNENELLGEGSSDTSKYPLTLEEKIMKSIEEEEKLLEAEINDTKESPPDLTLDNVVVPKIAHNLNKPDMMLEIPTHELIEFSDDEDDLTSNLEMSPDIETDEETKASDIPIEEIQVDVHKKEIDTETSKEIAESALEKEAQLAADILTKQLNAMDDDISLITDDLTEINKEINEDELLQDALQEELSECPIDKTEEPFKIINKLIDNTLNTAEESQGDNIQGIEDHITNSCEEMLLKIGENEAEDLENTELKSELPVDIPNKITDTKSTDDSMSKVISIESNIALKHTSNILESKVDQSTLIESVSSDSIDAKFLDKTSIETEKEMLLNESNVDLVIKESLTDVQRLKYNEPDTLKKELEVKNISNENAIDTIEKTLQLSEEIKKLQNDPKVDQPVTESLKKPDTNLQKSDIVANEPLPISTADREKTPELTMSSDESLNETMVELPPQTINEPKPSTSTVGEVKLTMSSDESLNESMVELPAQTIDETKPSTSTASKTKLTMSSDESPNETTVELPAETIKEPKPSTSTACEIKLTMSSDELLNETTVELPAQTIDEPKPSTSTACETELTMSSGESPNETTVELPAETINEPKPSTSTACEIKLTMSSDELLNETTVELPAQTIDEPKPSTSTACETKLTMSSYVSLEKTTVELPAQTIDEPKPLTSTSSQTKVPIGEESLTETMLESAQTIDEPKPSTSAFETKGSEASMFGSMMVQETSKDVPEMTDSLGLLAESSRVMEEDEEQEYDDEGEDEDDFDQDQDDESSNQMTAEHSEDSNAQQSETDQLKEDTVDKEFTFTITDVATEVNEVESMECDVTDTDADNIGVEKTQETNEIDEVVPADSTKDDKDDVQMDIETVKLSDTSDNEVDMETGGKTILEKLLLRDKPPTETPEKQSPSKRMKLEIVQQNHVMNFVDLEESSSEDDVQETKKQPQADQEPKTIDAEPTDGVKADHVKKIQSGSGLQTSPVKSVVSEVKEDTIIGSDGDAKETKLKTTVGLEVFNLDSDDDEPVKEEEKPEDTKQPLNNESLKCINKLCTSDTGIEYYIADSEAINFYDADKKKRGYVCKKCSDAVEQRNQELINGIKNYMPLLELSMNRSGEELVEISDSESEDEPELDQDQIQIIGVEGAKVAEEMLEQMINETWKKYKMDDRLAETQDTVLKEMERLKKESAEINEMLNECQVATDQLRNELYSTFEPDIRVLPPFVIYDMPNCAYSCVEPSAETEQLPAKRTLSPSTEVPPKRPAIPLGYAPLDDKTNQDKNIKTTTEKAEDDNTDVAVVKLSAESAPKDLPPPGEITMTPIKVGMTVYAMKNAFGSWMKAKIVEIMPKPANTTFTSCRVKFEHVSTKNPYKILPGRCLAYFDPPDVRMTIGRRVIALFKNSGKREAYYSGIIAEIPNPVNSYRYLIFFDDGYAQYAHHAQTRLVCECSVLVWEEVHPYSREFVRQYLFAYPERPMVRLHAGQNLKTEWRGKWWSSRVVRVDASLVEVQFLRRDRREWIYRGSTRLAPLYLELQAAERARPRAVPRAQPQARTNMPYVEYTRSDEQTDKSIEIEQPQQQQQQQLPQQQQQQQQQNEEIRRQRAVARKSTTAPPPPAPSADNLDNVTSRVVYYTPKNAVKPYKMVPHNCTPKCKRSDVLALKDLRTYNPLAKPLLSGWERQIVRWKGQKAVLYVAPCGRRLRDVRELHTYLRAIKSDMPVDLFDFSPATHCLAEFVLNKCFVGKKDLSHGKENVPVPCVNYYDESLPEFCTYNTERTPTTGVPLNLDPDFLCGCDCEDDCEDKTKCACWKMTLEGARTIGLEGDNIGYVYKRLPEPLPSGIYECNSRCKCKHTCLNRVAQHPLQLKLQVFKTLNRGWGIRALNDVPKGAFLCVYAGNLLTDATANLDGLNEGDEYLAELDYIEVVEQMKEGYEEDIPEDIKKLDKKELEASEGTEDEEEEEQSSEEETGNNKTDPEDDDFQPGFIGLGVAEFSKRLRKRESRKQKEEAIKKEKEEKREGDKEGNKDDDCITISDDEEVREPSCFTAAAGMGANEFISKYRSVRSLFGEDEACYIMDAKVQGNIGRYLNHSCSPNVFVQNVFVDTHDPRFPWVAFFALSHIRAGTELTWNYNYDVGSVPGKVLYCHCGASNCRGRLL